MEKMFCKCRSSLHNGVTRHVWCWEQIEVGHFNVVMETRWDCVTSRHLSHLAAPHQICPDSANCLFSVNWPTCPDFLFHSISNSVFFLSFFLSSSPSLWLHPFPSSPLSLSLSLCLSWSWHCRRWCHPLPWVNSVRWKLLFCSCDLG